MENNFKANIWKFYILEFFISFHLVSGVLVPFFIEWGKISFTQVMILQSWFMFWIFILEIPTGAIADFLGRKTSIYLGCFINVIAALIYASYPSFYIFLLAEFTWAMSVALLSGANEAFIYDTLKRTGKQETSKKVFGRIESIGLLGIMIGALVGSIIASKFGLRAPMLLTSIPFSIAFFSAITLKEPKHTKKKSQKNYINIMKEGVKFFYSNKILKILALDMVVIASIAYFMIWLYQPMLKQVGVDIAYFGVVHAAFVVSQILIISNYERLEKLFGSKKRLIFLSAAITGIMFIIGGLINSLPVVLLVIIIGGGFGLSRQPLFTSYINKHIPSEKRATVLSTISMFRRFTLVIVSPIVGLLTDWSLNYTLIILGAIAIIFSLISKVEEEHLID